MERLELDTVLRLEPAPEKGSFDYGIAVAKAAALAFPFLGSGVALFELIAAPLGAKRLSDWLEGLRQRIDELSQKITALTPARLAEDEAFSSAFFQAAAAVLRTHQKEKLDALRNAVLNVALGQQGSADQQTQFLALIDKFTAAHLTLLAFFQDPAGHLERRHLPVPAIPVGANMLAYDLVRIALPELHLRLQSSIKHRTASVIQTFQVLFDDLAAAGLVALQQLKEGKVWVVPRFPMDPRPYPVNSVITHLGEDFLAFIAEPRDGI